jgi:hypothetical protein
MVEDFLQDPQVPHWLGDLLNATKSIGLRVQASRSASLMGAITDAQRQLLTAWTAAKIGRGD